MFVRGVEVCMLSHLLGDDLGTDMDGHVGVRCPAGYA